MDEEPLVRVLRGEPTPEELAALVTVLAARPTRPDSQNAHKIVSCWSQSARPATRPASWRASALPR